MAAAIGLGTFLPWMGRALLILEVLLVAGTYVAVAIVTGELTRRDLAMVRSIVGRKRSATTAS
jgi:hypothetical protein